MSCTIMTFDLHVYIEGIVARTVEQKGTELPLGEIYQGKISNYHSLHKLILK